MALSRLFLLLSLISFNAFSQQYISGEGKFYAQEGDKVDFIKGQLLYEATKDVITKELAEMGLNHELFWQKYNERLETALKAQEEQLYNQSKIDENSSAAVRERFRKELRTKSLLKRRGFGQLESVIQSYAISGQSRSGSDPNSRYIKIDARVDKNKLSELYHKFIRGNRASDFGKLLVKIKVQLQGLTLSDMGIDNEKELLKELGVNWQDLLLKQRPNNITNVELLSETQDDKLQDLEKVEHEELFQTLPQEFSHSLLLVVTVDITKKLLDLDHGKAQIKYTGGLYLKELATGEVAWESDLSGGTQNIDFNSPKDIGQKVVNYVYRMPTAAFKSMSTSIEKMTPVSLVKRVNLFNYQNLTQLNQLIEYFQQIGLPHSLRARILTLTPTSSVVVIQCDASESDLKALLLNHQAAKKDLKYELIDSDGVLGIKFMHGATSQNT